MKPIGDMIEARPANNDFRFITEVIQRGRIRPAKFIHNLDIPYSLYKEMRDKGLINPENYFVNETAFFEFRHERAIISFVNCSLCDSLHFVIDRYLIIALCGKYPIIRTYQSKMNKEAKTKNWNKGIEINRLVNQTLNKINGTGESRHSKI